MAKQTKLASLDRGRDAVKAALIQATCEMLAEVGPNAMSVRSVATRAGVNHGQVHHYFGGKQGLIEAAMQHLSKEHFEHAHERAAGAPIPPALTLGEDSQYLRAIVRLVLDGDVETATREISEGISIPREVQRYLTQDYTEGSMPPGVKAHFALYMAMELGWAALSPYVMQMADVKSDEVDDVRAQARILARRFIGELEAAKKNK
ncbi:MAG: TetR/AcrR family transcriptional regulator [Pseudomonadota bacterium]